jgi:hypothetical protein
MRNRFICFLFLGLTLIACSDDLLAQAAKPTADLSGIWQRVQTVSAADAKWVSTNNEPIPYQPAAQQMYEYGRNYDLEGEQFRPELNPRISQCFPPDPNFLMKNDSSFEIIQASKRVVILFEWGHWIRQFFIDQEPTDDVDVTWMGHSIAKWEDDTLLVETTHVNDVNSYAGFIHSPEMHITERFRRVDHDTLVNVRTFEDPKVLSKPWMDTVIYKLKPRDFRITAKAQCDGSYRKEPVYYE